MKLEEFSTWMTRFVNPLIHPKLSIITAFVGFVVVQVFEWASKYFKKK